MNKDEETPSNLEGLGDLLPAEVLNKLNELLELLHQQDHSKQGSTVINIYADGSQHVENEVGNVEAGGIYNNFGGATIHHLVINGNMTKSGPEYYGESQEKTAKKEVTNEKLARAIENCQQFSGVTVRMPYCFAYFVMTIT